MKTSDFYYDLPQELIAQTPVEPRNSSRLMILHKDSGELEHRIFKDLPEYLRPGDCLILNDTRVIPARIYGVKEETGAVVEFLLLTQKENNVWECLCKPGKRAKVGTRFNFGEGKLYGTLIEIQEDGNRLVQFDCQGNIYAVLDQIGQMPLPPYIKEKLQDKERYQTVYSRELGSAAAPTAGLHFTPRVLDALRGKGVEPEELTLHVGAGTFKPVKSEEIEGHEMHTEYISVSRSIIKKLIDHDACATAVGTTSVRTLESLYHIGVTLANNPEATEEQLHVKQWQPYETECDVRPVVALQKILGYLDRHGMEALHTSTQIIIAPGYDYKIVKAMVTNFHQPQSTLLLLVSAFVKGNWHTIYDYALGHDFRFLSYGDSSLLIP